jgi:hypothetical protein
MSGLTDISTNMSNLKLINDTQVDLSYLNSVAPLVFSDPRVYSTVQIDIQFITQMGNQLFNYYANPDPDTQHIWYVALASGLTQAITDTNNVIGQIPSGNSKGPELEIVLNSFIADCQAIQNIIPVQDKLTQ